MCIWGIGRRKILGYVCQGALLTERKVDTVLFPARGCRTRLDVEEAVVLKGVGLFWVRWEDCKLLL